MTLIHVLGADIPHHNLTILQFFADMSARQYPEFFSAHFMLVSSDESLAEQFALLSVETFDNKAAIAEAIKSKAIQQPDVRFLFHGQFNPYIWLALLRNKIRPQQFWWHIWGADLYEDANGWKYRLFYMLRRQAQNKVGHVFGTRGDLHFFQDRHPRIETSLLYFPTRMTPLSQPYFSRAEPTGSTLTILIGNSGDRSNRHIEAIEAIEQSFGADVRLIIPMGYPANNQTYIDEVSQAAISRFGQSQVKVLQTSLAFDEYKQLLAGCDLAYMIFRRQQGIGTICLLTQFAIPVVINRQNPFWQDMAEQQIPYLFYGDSLTREQVRHAQHQLTEMDQRHIAFFNPNYIDGWLEAIQLAGSQA